MANYRIPGPLGMDHSEQLPIDPLTRQPQRIPGPLGSHCEYQLKQKLKIELEKKEIALDICQFILDMTGIIDPTPASDGTNVIISLSRGRWIDAVISVVSIVPYVGDFAKLGKLPRYLKSIKKAIRIARTDFHWSNALKRLFIPLKKVIDQLYELGANKLPPHANKTLSQIKREIDHFLKPASSGTTANQTVGEFIANSSKNSSPKVKQSANTPSKSKQANIEEKPKKGVSSEKESGIIDGNAAKNTKPKLPPRKQIELEPGKKGGWNKKLNGKLEPNTDYKVGNKTYKTDELGRVKQVDGELSLNTHDRNTYQQGKSGKEDGIKDGFEKDDGGHLISSRHDGAGEQINYVPMDSNLNRGAWRKMENGWDDALKEGKKVEVDIRPNYEGNNKRPSSFDVFYEIDGVESFETFKNVAGG